MAQQLHRWLRSFIEPRLRDALEWKRTGHARSQTVLSTACSPKRQELHDDGSNLRIKVHFDDCNREFVQLLGFESTERLVTCRVSDGESEIFAFFTPDAEIRFPKAHQGRPIKDIALGSVFGLSRFEILATPYGRSEQQLQLCIDELMAQMTGVRLGTIGRPSPLHSHESIQSLLDEFLQLECRKSAEEESSTSHRSKNRISAGRDLASEAVFGSDNGEATSFVDTEVQSQLATQPEPSRKRKRKRDAHNEDNHGVNVAPPVDIRKKKNNAVAPELMALLGRTEKPVTHSVSSESESTVASKLPQPATINQLEPNTAKSRHDSHPPARQDAGQRLPAASQSVVEDARANCDDRKAETTKERTALQQPQPCSSPKKAQAWHHIFETTPAVFQIPKRQKDILNRSDSWNPAHPGKTFPAGNLPREILEELHQPYLEAQAKSFAETTESLPSSDIPKSHPTTATSEMSGSSSDSETPVSGWSSSPAAAKTSIAPRPDSSPPLLPSSPPFRIPEPVVYTALPPDSSARLPDSSPRIPIAKTVAGNVEENIENAVEGDTNKVDEVVCLHDGHKEGRELGTEQASDSDIETSVPHALRQASQDRPSMIQSRSTARTPKTHEQMSAQSRYLTLNSAQKENVTPQVTPHTPSPLRVSSPESARNPSAAMVPCTFITEQVEQHSHPEIEPSARKPNIRTEHSWPLSPAKRAKPLGAIEFSQVVAENPANAAIEERNKWFAEQGNDSSGRPDSRNTVYQSFRAAYPDYTGTVEHFTQLCLKLRQSRQHQAVWDDYVIRHLMDYEQYVMATLRQGRAPIDYDDYYNDRVRSVKFTKGVLSAEMLDNLLPPPKTDLPSQRSVEHQRRRKLLGSYRRSRASEELDSAKFETRPPRVDAPPSEPKNGRTGRVLLPNANTYWSGRDWVRGSGKVGRRSESCME